MNEEISIPKLAAEYMLLTIRLWVVRVHLWLLGSSKGTR